MSSQSSSYNEIESFQNRLLHAPPLPRLQESKTSMDYFDKADFVTINKNKYNY